MNDLPRQTLCNIINQYGVSLCDDVRRCEGILRDLVGSHKREIHLLISALRERVPNELLRSTNADISIEITMARLAKHLHDDLAITLEASKWVIETWALALGIITIAELSQTNSFSNSSVVTKEVQLQPPSSTTQLSNSPEIKGFRLGMSLSQVLKQLPKGIKLNPPDKYGVQVIHISFTWDYTHYSFYYEKDLNYFFQYNNDVNQLICSDKFPVGDGLSSLTGLKSISFWFLDGEVIYIQLKDASIKWAGIDDFVQELNGSLKIMSKWNRESKYTKELWIKDRYYIKVWELVADIGIDLSDIQAWKAFETRKRAK